MTYNNNDGFTEPVIATVIARLDRHNIIMIDVRVFCGCVLHEIYALNVHIMRCIHAKKAVIRQDFLLYKTVYHHSTRQLLHSWPRVRRRQTTRACVSRWKYYSSPYARRDKTTTVWCGSIPGITIQKKTIPNIIFIL